MRRFQAASGACAPPAVEFRPAHAQAAFLAVEKPDDGASQPAFEIAARDGFRAVAPRAPTTRTSPIAALAALALHIALALACLCVCSAEEPDDDAGAPAIEVAFEPAAPKTEPSEAPAGPESTASTAAPDNAETTMKADEEQRPKDVSIESDEAAHAPPESTAKPEERKPAPAPPSTASVAAEDTAAPAQDEARPAPVATAPVAGPGRKALQERASWQRRLAAHLDRHKRYPAGERRHDARVEIEFTIDRSGHIRNSAILESSGSPAFDAAALDMMRRSDPAPPPPPSVADNELTFRLPVVFKPQTR